MEKMAAVVTLGVVLLGGASLTRASAHAFPERSRPRVGATVAKAPHEVRIWFDAGLEPLFCTLRVKDAQGQWVNKGKGHVKPGTHDRLLETRVPVLPPGKYHVYWSVIAVDGHHTEGHYPFRVR